MGLFFHGSLYISFFPLRLTVYAESFYLTLFKIIRSESICTCLCHESV